MTEKLSLEEAIQLTAQANASYDFLLYCERGKPEEPNKHFRAGWGLGRMQAQAAGTRIFTAWSGNQDTLYTRTYLATWDELEQAEQEEEEA